MVPELIALKQPIALRAEHVVDKQTAFRVQQHGKAWSSAKFTVLAPEEVANGKASSSEKKDANTKGLSEKSPGESSASASASASMGKTQGQPQTLMYVDGQYLSKDEKRSFRDASGLPLFDVSHRDRRLRHTWFIDLPGGTGDPIGRVVPRVSALKDNLDVEIKNASADGEEAKLHVQGQDIWKQRTNVYLGDKVVMTAKRTDKLATYLPGRKNEWDVDIAAGMDMSLASVIVIILAANMYDSSGQTPNT